MTIIDGKEVAKLVEEKIKQEISELSGRQPGLAVIMVGDNSASKIYVKRKQKKCSEVGIKSTLRHLSEDVSQEDLLAEIRKCNEDEKIDGILVQLPLPKHIDKNEVLYAIDPIKDIDGFHPINVGKLLCGDKTGFVPCTPLAVHELLKHYEIDAKGKNVVVMGRSNLVGKPMAAIMMQDAPYCNGTVTVLHRHSQNAKEICQRADILIVAIGSPKFVTADMVKEGAIVVDVGINRVDSEASPKGYEIVGDVDFAEVEKKCSMITPVPGGVGPMTVAMLLNNTMTSFKRRNND